MSNNDKDGQDNIEVLAGLDMENAPFVQARSYLACKTVAQGGHSSVLIIPIFCNHIISSCV